MRHTQQGKLYTEIVLEIFKLSGLLVTEGDALAKEVGLTSARWKVLGALANAGFPMTVSQIAHVMGQARQSVQRLSDEMEKAGFLVYEDNPHHKKAKLVAMTPKGKDVFLSLEQKQIPWANENAAEIEIPDLKIALDTLKKTVQKLDKHLNLVRK